MSGKMNESVYKDLTDMGFEDAQCRQAAMCFSDAQSALDWIFAGGNVSGQGETRGRLGMEKRYLLKANTLSTCESTAGRFASAGTARLAYARTLQRSDSDQHSSQGCYSLPT